MRYTLWSRDRLLGESDLSPVQSFPHVQFGWFVPTPEGQRSLEVLTGGRAALWKLSRMLNDPMRAMMRPKNRQKGEWPADIRNTSTYADFMAYQDHLEAMELQ